MVLADANVLLEILLPGRLRFAEAARSLSQHADVRISMLSVHLILHFGLKEGLALYHITKFLSSYIKESLHSEDYNMAMSMLSGKDHEDAMQLAVALRLGCESIITFDQKFAKLYADHINFIIPK